MTIKPLETIYNGYRFRSRLEARWAVFFKTLGIRYEYEREGFKTKTENYLPDFYLPDCKCWIEIKPTEFNDFSNKKIQQFAEATEERFLLVVGPPREGEYFVRLLTENPLPSDAHEDFIFALARRASEPELCLLGEFSSCNLTINSTDDGEREPLITVHMQKAFDTASQERFDT